MDDVSKSYCFSIDLLSTIIPLPNLTKALPPCTAKSFSGSLSFFKNSIVSFIGDVTSLYEAAASLKSFAVSPILLLKFPIKEVIFSKVSFCSISPIPFAALSKS